MSEARKNSLKRYAEESNQKGTHPHVGDTE